MENIASMNLLTIIAIALGLAMDAFAVSIAIGAAYEKPIISHAFKAAFAFGIFQAIMPVAGWFAGLALRNSIEAYGHWVAFCLIGATGCKICYGMRKTRRTLYFGHQSFCCCW